MRERSSTRTPSSGATGEPPGGERRERARCGRIGLDVVLREHDRAVLVDHERAADDAHRRLAVVLLLAPGAVGLGHRVILVGEQPEAERVLVAELRVRRGRVGRDAEDGGPDRVEVGLRVAQRARLDRAARGVVLGVEVEDDARALEVGEAHGAAVVGRQFEVGSGVTGREHVFWRPGVVGRASAGG